MTGAAAWAVSVGKSAFPSSMLLIDRGRLVASLVGGGDVNQKHRQDWEHGMITVVLPEPPVSCLAGSATPEQQAPLFDLDSALPRSGRLSCELNSWNNTW
jgi:hypothetical protein